MAKTVKENFVFNLINNISGVLFPLITFPYASRIMLADGIGQVNFYQSILSYVSLFSSIGIPLYAIREIARVRDSVKEMNIVSVEILTLHLFLTLLGYAVVVILCMTIVEIQANLPLFIILSFSIIFSAIGCEWFYQGIEDFKYITIRSVFVKCIYVLMLFLLVRSKNDLLIYGVLCILGTVGNNIFNFLRLRKYIDKTLFRLSELHPFRHFLPALNIFALNLVVSLYLNLNPVLLGFMVDVKAVGLYTVASKISHMLLGVTSALQHAVLPRTSNLLKVGDYDNFLSLTQKVLDFIIMFTLPLSVVLVIISPSLIVVLSGESYRSAALSLAILSPIVFVIALSGLFGIQMLYPQGKERLVIIATGLGAIINLLLDLLLIPYFSYNGASIATLSAEIVVTVSMFFLGRKYLPLKIVKRQYSSYFWGTLIMGCLCSLVYYSINNDFLSVILASIIAFLFYGLWLIYKKDYFVMSIIKGIKCKLYQSI